MLTAGLDQQAARWSAIVDSMGDDGDRAWALLALASARPAVDMSASRVNAFAGRDGGHRGQLLAALGRSDASDGRAGVDTPRAAAGPEIAPRPTVASRTFAHDGTGADRNWSGVPPPIFTTSQA